MDQLVSSEKEMRVLISYLDEKIKQGKKVLLHCVGGLGRSGMAAASYLKYKGMDSGKAIDVVREARGPRAVETKIQEEFVHDILFGN
jgi:protein-tyrosine phosphatase